MRDIGPSAPRAILERVNSGSVSLNDAIDLYSKSGNLDELSFALRRRQNLGYALYVLSELGSKAAGVWKDAIPFATDPDPELAWYALDIMHTHSLADIDTLYDAISRVNLREPRLFSKVFAIVISLSESQIQRLCRVSAELDAPPMHREGLRVLCQGSRAPIQDVRRLLLSSDATLMLYGCCAVARYFNQDGSLVRVLPASVRRRLQIHLEHP